MATGVPALIQQALQSAAEHPLQVAEEMLTAALLLPGGGAVRQPQCPQRCRGVRPDRPQRGDGALFNVAINLGGIKDPAFRERLQADKDRIMGAADGLRKEIMEALDARFS